MERSRAKNNRKVNVAVVEEELEEQQQQQDLEQPDDENNCTLQSVTEEEDDDNNNNEKEDSLFALDLKHAKKARFPPGCPVVVCSVGSSSTATGKVLTGTVEQVLINLGSEQRENVYRICLNNDPSEEKLLKKQEELLFAPRCPVSWHNNNNNTANAEQQNAIVLSSEYYPAVDELDFDDLEASFLYSIQLQLGSGKRKLLHGVLPDKISYRPPADAKTKAKERTKTNHKQVSVNDKENATPKTVLENTPSVQQTIIPPGDCTTRKRAHPQPAMDQGNATTTTTTTTGQSSSEAYHHNKNGSKRTNLLNPNNNTREHVLDTAATGLAHSKEEVEEDPMEKEVKNSNDAIYNHNHPPDAQHQHQHQQHRAKKSNAEDFVWNETQNFFDNILRDRPHRLRQVIRILVRDDNAASSFLVHRCLSWHLIGSCHSSCARREDHKALSPREAYEMEQALQPFTSPTGPIFAKTTPIIEKAKATEETQQCHQDRHQDDQAQNNGGGVQREQCNRNNRSNPFTDGPVFQSKEETVVANETLNPFHKIQRGTFSKHRLGEALGRLSKMHYNRVIPAVIPRHCLYWHLYGVCHSTCTRAHDHRELSSEEANRLEHALKPVTSENGPIFAFSRPILEQPARPPPTEENLRAQWEKIGFVPPSEVCQEQQPGNNSMTGVSNDEDWMSVTVNKSDTTSGVKEEPVLESPAPMAKRPRLSLDTQASVEESLQISPAQKHFPESTTQPPEESNASSYCWEQGKGEEEGEEEEALCSVPFHIPKILGYPFMYDVLIGEEGYIMKHLEQTFCCSIEFKGKLVPNEIPYDGPELLSAYLIGDDMRKLFDCREEMERLLIRATQPVAQALLMVKIGLLNKHRQISDTIVHIGDSLGHMGEDLVWATTEPSSNIIFLSNEDRKDIFSRWVNPYRQCQVRYVTGIVHGLGIAPHVLIVGPDVQSVSDCRRDFRHHLKMEGRRYK